MVKIPCESTEDERYKKWRCDKEFKVIVRFEREYERSNNEDRVRWLFRTWDWDMVQYSKFKPILTVYPGEIIRLTELNDDDPSYKNTYDYVKEAQDEI